MTVTSEGLRIELLEIGDGHVLREWQREPTEHGRVVADRRSPRAGQAPNKVSLEGHTDSQPFPARAQLQQLGALGRPR